jgi:hypothetical protein
MPIRMQNSSPLICAHSTSRRFVDADPFARKRAIFMTFLPFGKSRIRTPAQEWLKIGATGIWTSEYFHVFQGERNKFGEWRCEYGGIL